MPTKVHHVSLVILCYFCCLSHVFSTDTKEYALSCFEEAKALVHSDGAKLKQGLGCLNEAIAIFETIPNNDSLAIISKSLLLTYHLAFENKTDSKNLINKLIDNYKKYPNQLPFVYLQIAKGFENAGMHAEALKYIDQGLSSITSQPKSVDYALLMIEKSKVLFNSDNDVKFATLIANLEEALSILRTNHLSNGDVLQAHILLGNLYLAKNNNREAERNYKIAIEAYHNQQPRDEKNEMATLNNLFIVYANTGDFDRAKNIMELILSFLKRPENYDAHLLFTSTNNLAQIYLERKHFSKAIIYFKEKLDYANEIGGNYEKAHAYMTLGKVYLENQQLDSSEYYLNKSFNLAATEKNIDLFAEVYVEKAKFLFAKNNFKQCRSTLEEGFKLLKDKDIDLSILSNLLCKIYTLDGEYDKALAISDISMELSLGEKMDFNNFDADNFQNGYAILGLLTQRGNIFKYKYDRSKSKDDLLIANKIYDKCINILEDTRRSYLELGSKLSLRDETHQLYENSIDVALKLAKLNNNDTKWLQKAFQRSEDSKNSLLKDALRNNNSLEFASVPKDIRERELQLRQQINELEVELIETPADDSKVIYALKNKLQNAKEERIVLFKNIEQQYPDYYKIKYQRQEFNFQKWQQDLEKNNKTLIEFFNGEHQFYVFVMSKAQLSVFEIEKSSTLKEEILAYKNTLTHYDPTAANNDKSQLEQLSYHLYSVLFQPFEKILTPKILIIPDGELALIPFDALFYEQASNTQNFKTYPYLLRKYQIGYSYSASLLDEMQYLKSKKKNASKFLIAFAPSFSKDYFYTNKTSQIKITALKNNVRESEEITHLLEGDLYKDGNATLSKFREKAPGYALIHLSTHAFIDANESNNSYLTFANESPSSQPYQFLFSDELYNMNLSADLVVLSACQTGLGKIINGEGMLSLARGFLFAGVSSVVQSLWSISDTKTAWLMKEFYSNLKMHLNKDEALCKAKLDYLKNSRNAEAHPYFWAAMIPIGDMSCINVQKMGISNIYIFMSLAAFIVVAAYFWRKHNLPK